MNQPSSADGGVPFEGKMFLYEDPDLLSIEKHGGLGLSPIDRPFDFVRKVRAIPVAVSEAGSAQKSFPLIFSNPDEPTLLAIMGIEDDNLFVGDDGHWREETYVPAYLRCHPFALAETGGDQFAVVIDQAAASVSSTPEVPFFRDGELTAEVRAAVDLSSQFSSDRKRTAEFCERLKGLGLLVARQVTHQAHDNAEQQPIAMFAAVDFEKLRQLDAETLHSLHVDGFLSAVYAHAFSQENWKLLIARQQARKGAA